MKSINFREYLIYISMLLLVTDAIADDNIETAKAHFALDYAASVTYHEPGVAEKGKLTGIYLDWDTAPSKRLTFLGNVTALFGGLTYDGATQSGIPVQGSTTDRVFMGELLLGLHLGEKNDGTLYVGLGDRYWTDTISDGRTSTGGYVFGYRREINYLYTPIGLRISSGHIGHWHMEIDTKYMWLIRGTVKTHLESISDFNTLKNTQDRGHGYAVSLRFAHSLLGNSTFNETFIEPYYQVWKVDRSGDATLYFAGAPIGYGYEPDNATRIIGARFGTTF